MEASTAYDDRYLAGIVLFNRGDFFEAHEVWEDLWVDSAGPERSFYQGLIQAAVGLCHFCNGNLRGAVKLFHSSRRYLAAGGSSFLGLDLTDFDGRMERCFGGLLAAPEPAAGLVIEEDLIPEIHLQPPPGHWPDPQPYLDEAGNG
jgi:hypothetical protein